MDNEEGTLAGRIEAILFVAGEAVAIRDLARALQTEEKKIRETVAALKDEYDEAQMQQDIMNSVHNVLGTKLSNVVRFVACNALGLFSSVSGVVASAFDSFILSKVAQGWHPDFFLDDSVKEKIDAKIREKEEEERKALMQERFKGVGRNDPCPCGSGKKFKKCHGKGF